MPKWFASEVAGTFLLVFFGCGSVANAVAGSAYQGLFQVAAIWGLGLSAAIFLSAKHSGAHLNPAITLAFSVFGDFPKRRVPGYIAAQFVGAILAAVCVLSLFGPTITAFEQANGILRGEPGSEASAMVFGEYYPNPGGAALTEADRERAPFGTAFFAEFLGTAILAFAVFGFTAKSNDAGPRWFTPVAIGITLAALISIFAPLTQAGFNPARDLGPRLVSAAAGWGSVPFTTNGSGWLTVYIIAPCLGSLAGAFLATRLFRESQTD